MEVPASQLSRIDNSDLSGGGPHNEKNKWLAILRDVLVRMHWLSILMNTDTLMEHYRVFARIHSSTLSSELLLNCNLCKNQLDYQDIYEGNLYRMLISMSCRKVNYRSGLAFKKHLKSCLSLINKLTEMRRIVGVLLLVRIIDLHDASKIMLTNWGRYTFHGTADWDSKSRYPDCSAPSLQRHLRGFSDVPQSIRGSKAYGARLSANWTLKSMGSKRALSFVAYVELSTRTNVFAKQKRFWKYSFYAVDILFLLGSCGLHLVLIVSSEDYSILMRYFRPEFRYTSKIYRRKRRLPALQELTLAFTCSIVELFSGMMITCTHSQVQNDHKTHSTSKRGEDVMCDVATCYPTDRSFVAYSPSGYGL
ncbi:hypothetical protein CLF_113092, partial [Clonorchis sinensis]